MKMQNGSSHIYFTKNHAGIREPYLGFATGV